MKKVLIVHPDLARLGGIESYYRKLFPHLSVAYESFGIARRPGETTQLRRLARIVGDYYRFWVRLSAADVDTVHLNPSLEPKSFYRESLFLFLAKLRGKRVVVFFRGWSVAFENSLELRHGRRCRLLYGRADAFIVLAESFASALRRWRLSQPVYREVTVIEDAVVNALDIEALVDARARSTQPCVLFISRLKHSKGVLETIAAFERLVQTLPQARLVIAGDGEAGPQARALVAQLKLEQVEFTGAIDGSDKHALYRSANLLCFPTAHDEGFPNTVVEAMAFGLPVVSCAVGGLADFFQHGVHGYLVPGRDPRELADRMVELLGDRALAARVSRTNHAYARDHFLASAAAARLERIYAALASSEPR